MTQVRTGELPPAALLRLVKAQGAFTDCYEADVPGQVTLADYVQAFYTTSLFKLERVVLSVVLRRRFSDAQAMALARGESDRYAFWTVQARSDDQILMRDLQGHTRSWLMVQPLGGGPGAATRLWFGSAVMPQPSRSGAAPSMGWAFHALLGFHRLYSRALLRAARRRLGN